MNKFHKCWFLASCNGIVHSGHCTCMAGLGEVCSHVAALFAVEMANDKERPAPTSVACMWNKTSKKEHNPDAPYLEDLTDEEETSSASETEHQEENHLPNLIELLRTKFSGMLKHVRADDSIHSMLLDCSLLHETIQNIELSTRDQASSAMWNHQRKGRVTSSLFGKILRCKTGQKDGLVMCDCCETALLEIKCPARGKGLVVEQIPRKKFLLDDSLNLKEIMYILIKFKDKWIYGN
ncbi:hypothetical protein TNCV_4693411 [Trichonephila clavipes]|uniref:SWIM-type domain-containing protein n=1 Tax=Trichonephila clavipes TaxID=2585209 RepID=A0A8X6WBF8_TRICX|nr:hypothetical protein TNCV_4693411 [Trichonephila clavipes]